MLVVLALIALNGFFAMSEMAVMTSRKLRLKQLAEDPAFHFLEYLSRRVMLIKANGARLVAEFIAKQARDGKWMKNPLAAAILESQLPPPQKADYLLSVFYTDFNRRMVKLTDSDDINFQQALAELIQRGEKKQ